MALTAAQQAAVRAELASDPRGKGYALHLPADPERVIDLLNAPTETMIKPIRSTTAQAWAAAGPYAAIVDATVVDPVTKVPHPCRASCLVLRETLASGVDIHVERTDVQQMLGAWVATGICTRAQVDDLYARATQAASRAEVLGLPQLSARDIIDALESA